MRLAQEADPETAMIRNDLDPLILDLLEWIGREPRSYADVIDAWRTSCPRLTVWEDAMDRGFAMREHGKGREVMIRLTAAGREFLRKHGRVSDALVARMERSEIRGRHSSS
jgi:DNA-binding MarR family transcriptional regulator